MVTPHRIATHEPGGRIGQFGLDLCMFLVELVHRASVLVDDGLHGAAVDRSLNWNRRNWSRTCGKWRNWGWSLLLAFLLLIFILLVFAVLGSS